MLEGGEEDEDGDAYSDWALSLLVDEMSKRENDVKNTPQLY